MQHSIRIGQLEFKFSMGAWRMGILKLPGCAVLGRSWNLTTEAIGRAVEWP